MPKSHWTKYYDAEKRHRDAENEWRKAEDDQRKAEDKVDEARKVLKKLHDAMEEIYKAYKKAFNKHQTNPNEENLKDLEFWKSWWWWLHEFIYDPIADWLEKLRKAAQDAREKALDALRKSLQRRKEMEKARRKAEWMDKFRREFDKSPTTIPNISYISTEKMPEEIMLALKGESGTQKMLEAFMATKIELI